MKIETFINNYKEAFGEAVELPIVFWYSDTAIANTEKIGGCFFKGMKPVREGNALGLSVDNIGCGGGKFYTGFTDMPEHVPNFVSLKEKYKKTPEMVVDFAQKLGVPRTEKKYLNFVRIDKITNFDDVEGIIFFANPDIISGLTAWAYFDNNADDAVTAIFGSGCSAMVTNAVIENERKGRRTFLGLFDISVRVHFEPNMLGFMIPICRFKEMYHTMRDSCLFDANTWGKVKERI
ncbi:hypothetical protein FACS1894199_11660 [Bacteroidia bacterium]|nr:hypothetical protein FACS1894199_11660 [Bacteroidia bacterium]